MDYDSKEGIGAELSSYETLYAVMHARNEHGRINNVLSPTWETDARPSHLTPMIVLGRYRTDETGRCSRLNREIFTDADRSAMPVVMTDPEFRAFFEKRVQPRLTESFYALYEGVEGMAPSLPLPPPHLVCMHCGDGWNIVTCHDIDVDGNFEDLDISEFAGKTLREAEEELNLRKDALRSFGNPLYVHNQQWTNLDADEEMATREERGWRRVTKEYIIQSGDDTSVFRYDFYHGPCFRLLNDERAIAGEKQNIEGVTQLLEETGFENVRITRTDLPKHLREWIIADTEDSEDAENAMSACMYYRVETAQGAFGILQTAYPMLDLTESGAEFLRELEPELALELPDDFPSLIAFTGEPEQMRDLRQLMIKKQKQAKRHKRTKKQKGT